MIRCGQEFGEMMSFVSAKKEKFSAKISSSGIRTLKNALIRFMVTRG